VTSQSHEVIRRIYKQLRSPNKLTTPFTPNSFFAFMLPLTGGWGASKLTLSPGAGNPTYSTACMSTNVWEKRYCTSMRRNISQMALQCDDDVEHVVNAVQNKLDSS